MRWLVEQKLTGQNQQAVISLYIVCGLEIVFVKMFNTVWFFKIFLQVYLTITFFGDEKEKQKKESQQSITNPMMNYVIRNGQQFLNIDASWYVMIFVVYEIWQKISKESKVQMYFGDKVKFWRKKISEYIFCHLFIITYCLWHMWFCLNTYKFMVANY